MPSSSNDFSWTSSERLSSGETTEKLGFSVVAATSSTVRFSTAASRASCWVLEKRCTSSMKSTVRSPWSRRRRAFSMTARTSLTPEFRADSATKWRPDAAEISDAMVVLPVPGGPKRMTEESPRPSMSRCSGVPGPSTWSCPTTSARLRGRIRTASGACEPGWKYASASAGPAPDSCGSA